MKNRKKALILTWDGYQDQEVIYPFYRLKEEDFDIALCAEKEGLFYGILGTKMIANHTCNKITTETVLDYDFLLLPGGVKALEKIRQQKDVLNAITHYVQSGRIVASTCHGAQLLVSARVVTGRNIAAYYSIEDDINNAGAIYSREPVVVDANLITSPHYDHMGIWMKTAIEKYHEWSKLQSV
jgi:protease I